MVKLKFTKKALGALALTVLMLFSNINNVQAQNVCKIGTTEYTTIQAAVTAASDGAEIQLITDAVIDNTITISKNITIDMAGHDITVNATGYAFAVNGKTFKIKDSTFNNAINSEIISSGSSKGLVSLNSQSTLDFSNFSVHGASNATAAYRTTTDESDAIIFDNHNYDNDIKLTNVNIYTANTILGGKSTTRHEYNGKLTVSGGTFTGTRGFIISGQSKSSTIDGVKMTIESSGSNGYAAIYALTTVTVSNSEITGRTGNDGIITSFDSGNVTINNSVVSAYGVGEGAIEAQYGGNVTINSGTFSSNVSQNSGAVAFAKRDDNRKKGGIITINGGYFDGGNSNYVLYSNGDNLTDSQYPSKIIVSGAATIKGSNNKIAGASGNYCYVHLGGGSKYQGVIELSSDIEITGNVTLDVAAGGMFKYSSGNIPESYITADMTGVTAASVKLIEYTGSGAKTYNNVTLVNGENYKKEVKDDNDLYAVLSPSTSDLAVDDDWATGKTKGDPVVFGNKTYFFGYNAFATIQNAVNTADVSNGAVTINVAEGTYNENVSFYVYEWPQGWHNLENVKFTDDTGEWYGRLHFVADGEVIMNGYFNFTDNDHVQMLADITVDGFTFDNQSYAVYMLNSSGTSKGIVIRNNTITYSDSSIGAATPGSIYINSASVDEVTVSGNSITGATSYSMDIGGVLGTLNNVVVSNNTIKNSSAIGIFGKIVEGNGITLNGNTFDNCDYAVYYNNMKEASTGKLTLSNNTFVNNTDMVVVGFRQKAVKDDFTIGYNNLFKATSESEGTEIIGWAETSAKKYLVNTNASNRNAVYYSNRLYLGNETAFTTIKAAYDAAPDDGILIINGNEVAKSSIDMSTLGVNSDWSTLEDGQAVTVEDETFYGGLNAYSTVAAATAAVQTGQTVKLFSNIEETSVTTIPGGTFLNTNTNDLSATDITMGSKLDVTVTGLQPNTNYMLVYYDANGAIVYCPGFKTGDGETTYRKTTSAGYVRARVIYPDWSSVPGANVTNTLTTGTLELDDESQVSFSSTLTNNGLITVDMTGATQNTYKLIDNTGSTVTNYGANGSSFRFVEGKDYGYTLQTLDNDLYAYKSTVSKTALAINSGWTGTAFGSNVTLNEVNYTYGINAFSNFTEMVNAISEETTSIVINGETYGLDGNSGSQILSNTNSEAMMISTVGAAKMSDPSKHEGNRLVLSSDIDGQSYVFAGGSNLTIFQLSTDDMNFTINGDLKVESSMLLEGTITVGNTGSLSMNAYVNAVADGTNFHEWGIMNVEGNLNLNLSDGGGKRIQIGDNGYNNDGIELNVNGGTVTVRQGEYNNDIAATRIYGVVGEDGTPATLSVTNGGLYDTYGTIINNGVIKIDVKKDDNNRYSMVMTKDITNTGTITIDMTGATEASYKVIDYTGEGPKTIADYGTVTFTGGTATYYAEVKENDLYATKAVASVTIGETTTYYSTFEEAMEAAKEVPVAERAEANSVIVTILADAEVNGYTFNGDYTGITLIGVEGHKFTGGFSADGSYMTSLKNGAFKNLNFVECGIVFSSAMHDMSGMTIEGCHFTCTGTVADVMGIQWNKPANCIIDGLTIKDNIIEGVTGTGIILNGVAPADNGKVTITGNTIKNVVVQGMQLLNLEGLTISGNTLSGIGSWTALNLSGSQNVTIEKNAFTFNPAREKQTFLGNITGSITLGDTETTCNTVTLKDGTTISSALDIVQHDFSAYPANAFKDGAVIITDETIFDEESGKITDGPIFASAANINSRVAEGYEVAFMNDVTYSGLIYYTDVADKTVELAYGNVNGTIKVPQGFTFAIKDGVTFTAGSKIYLPIIHGSSEFNNWVTNNIPEGQENNVTVYGIVCKIGETMYNTLADAIAEATATDVITMLVNISDNVTIPAEKTVTIDLNGKTLSSNGSTVITNNGTLTLISNNGVGVINGATGENYAVVNNGTFYMYGGSVTGNANGVSQNNEMTLGGSAKITDNTTRNLYLPDKKIFSIDKTIVPSDMLVGITTQIAPSAGNYITLTAGNDYDYSQYFKADNTLCSVIDTDGHILKLTNDVKITLSAEDGAETLEILVNGVSVGTSAYVQYNSEVTIKTTPVNGYAFKGWYKKDGTMFNGKFSHTFNATESLDLTAKFTDQVIWVRVKKGN